MPPDGREGFFRAIGADAVEQERFVAFDRELLATSAHTNIVARSSLDSRWNRHYLDSAQIFACLPQNAACLLDIGSGAGFPGAVLAILAAGRRPQLSLTLCDSVGKKVAFLRRSVAAAGLANTNFTSKRVEALEPDHPFDVITARAVTALGGLLELAVPHLAPGGLMIFPKGRRVELELDEAREQWSFDLETRSSMTDDEARILLITAPKRRT